MKRKHWRLIGAIVGAPSCVIAASALIFFTFGEDAFNTEAGEAITGIVLQLIGGAAGIFLGLWAIGDFLPFEQWRKEYFEEFK